MAPRTINNWKRAHPEFLQSLEAGKGRADAKGAESLYRRALGYSHPEVNVWNYQGAITMPPITKHYPPDPTSCILWLNKGQSSKWRDKVLPTLGSAATSKQAADAFVSDQEIRRGLATGPWA